MSKGKSFWLLMITILSLLTPGVLAYGAGEAVQVTDQAELLSEEEVQELSELAGDLELSLNWDVLVLTVADAKGRTAMETAEQWVVANAQSEDGVICLIDMDNRELYITAFGEAIYYLTDERREKILDAAYYDVVDEDYYKAMECMLDGVRDAVQRGIPSDQHSYDVDTKETVYYKEHRRIEWWEALIALGAALAAGGITIGAIVGKYRLKWQGYQYSCREYGHVSLSTNRDVFVNQVVTHRHIPKNPPSNGGSGSSGRSTVHTGAGGRKFSGSSRKF